MPLREPPYTIIPPGRSDDQEIILAAVNVVSRLFEAGVAAHRAQTDRALIEIETKARIEEFRTQMGLLEQQLNFTQLSETERLKRQFDIADAMVQQGDHAGAIVVLELIAKQGRKSLVEELIDYHERITLGMFKEKDEQA